MNISSLIDHAGGTGFKILADGGCAVDVEDSDKPESGEAGGAAQRKYEQLSSRRENRMDEKYGRLAGVVKFLSQEPQSITAWKTGAEGERIFAQRINDLLGDRAVLLNDRSIPGSRANIDHLVVAPSGIWVVDAKKYKGVVEKRNCGNVFSPRHELYVGGRNQMKLVAGLNRQVDVVKEALNTFEYPVTVSSALCFVETEWKMFSNPFQVQDTWICSPKKLARLMDAESGLSPEAILEVASFLARALPEKPTGKK